jgi:hypothetical protein
MLGSSSAVKTIIIATSNRKPWRIRRTSVSYMLSHLEGIVVPGDNPIHIPSSLDDIPADIRDQVTICIPN